MSRITREQIMSTWVKVQLELSQHWDQVKFDLIKSSSRLNLSSKIFNLLTCESVRFLMHTNILFFYFNSEITKLELKFDLAWIWDWDRARTQVLHWKFIEFKFELEFGKIKSRFESIRLKLGSTRLVCNFSFLLIFKYQKLAVSNSIVLKVNKN